MRFESDEMMPVIVTDLFSVHPFVLILYVGKYNEGRKWKSASIRLGYLLTKKVGIFKFFLLIGQTQLELTGELHYVKLKSVCIGLVLYTGY